MNLSPKLSEAIAEYLLYAKVEAGHSETTLTKRASVLRSFIRWMTESQGLDDPRISEIKAPMIGSYMAYLRDNRQVKSKTTRGYLQCLRGLYNYLLENRLVSDSGTPREAS